MQSLGLPVTVLRPMALMELMTDRVYYPAVSTWSVMPKLMGTRRPVGWLCADDLGAIAATVFAAPETYIGQDLHLASDVQSIDVCREVYQRVMGRKPPRIPMPVWLFERIVGTDLTTMWRWLATHEIALDTGPVRAIHPEAQTVDTWLGQQRNAPTDRA